MDQIDCFDGVNLPRRSGVNLLRRTGDNFSVFSNRLPKSTKYKGYIDISKETLCGAGYNLTYTGMATLFNWEGISVKAFRYNDVALIAHPHEPSRYLIRKSDD